MKPKQAITRLRELLPKQQLTVAAGIKTMMQFYETERAEGLLDQDGDMLLLQWGTYDWGKGENFELDITRQFIWDGRSWLMRLITGEDGFDPEVWQLSLTFRFPPNDQLRSFSSGNQWCKSPANVAEIKAYILENTAYQALADRRDANVDLTYGAAE